MKMPGFSAEVSLDKLKILYKTNKPSEELTDAIIPAWYICDEDCQSECSNSCMDFYECEELPFPLRSRCYRQALICRKGCNIFCCHNE